MEESYLRPVEESDLFILIVGVQVTDAVIAECIRAKELGKHILIFVKKVERQSQAVRLLLKQLDKKYTTFASPEELRQQVKEAIDQMSALSLRSPRGRISSPSILRQTLPFVGKSVRFRVAPIIPRSASEDLFLIREADAQKITLHKIGPQEDVSVPTNRVTEFLDVGTDGPKILVLNGRLQHITTQWQWRFFEDKPDASSEHGFAKQSHTQDGGPRTHLAFEWKI